MQDTPNDSTEVPAPRARWRMVLYEMIFETDTPAGKAFNIILIISILASVAAVMLDTIASVQMIMIFGYGIIAVPTGIVTVEMSQAFNTTQACPECSAEGHHSEVRHFKFCGAMLNPEGED